MSTNAFPQQSNATMADLLAVARGEKVADLLLQNCRLVNVYTGTIEQVDIAIYGQRIAGVGPGYDAEQVVDLAGAYVAPGLIDAHVHIESSLCLPAQFAAALLPRGVTCAITDPHEIANVAGVDGIRFMAESSRHIPLHVVTMAPSAVPATHMETSGAALDAEDLLPLLYDGTVHGLAEMMNFPGVINDDAEVAAKIKAFAPDAFMGHPLDGHAPALSGQPLNAYAAAGIGSEHECTTVEEAAEKLARGFYILIREATNAHNLETLLPLVTPENSRRICFCTDDRMPGDLLNQGSIDYMVRTAIAFGLPPITALRMATLNTAEWFGLRNRGGVAPGRMADLFVFEDLNAPTAKQVYASGHLVAEEGALVADAALYTLATPPSLRDSVRVDLERIDFRLPAQPNKQIRAIGSLENQLVTEERIVKPKVVAGFVVADVDRDLLKMMVINRHANSREISGREISGREIGVRDIKQTHSIGFIQGFGLHSGAIAGTVAHDHHNLVIIGVNDQSMQKAAQRVAELGGGLVACDGTEVIAELALPVAGLMSEEPITVVHYAYDALLEAAHNLGSTLHDPFMAMSFMALEVIPKLKLTDLGLVDVEKFDFVDLFV